MDGTWWIGIDDGNAWGWICSSNNAVIFAAVESIWNTVISNEIFSAQAFCGQQIETELWGV